MHWLRQKTTQAQRMPKYSYRCESCDHQFIIFHGVKDDFPDCPHCENSNNLTKLVNKVYIKGMQTGDINLPIRKVGDLTKEAIKDNKDILDDTKKRIRSLNYDDATDIPD